MTERAPDGPRDLDAYREACRVDAEALLACVVFALHHPPGGAGPSLDLTGIESSELDDRLRAFIEFDDGDSEHGRWRL